MKNKRGMFGLFAIMMLLAVFASGCTQPMDQAGDLSLKNVKDRGRIMIGIDPDFPPMRLYDGSGKLVGFDVDVANDIALKLDVQPELSIISWGDLFDNVKAGDVDIIISAITITQERSQQMLFSSPYLDAGQVIMTRKDNNEITSPENLRGKKIGVLNGTTCKEAAMMYAEPQTITSYNSYTEIINNLIGGKLDAMVTDLIGASGYAKQEPSLKIVGEPFTSEYYGIATKLGNNALMDEINRILREMKRDGKLDEIKNKWLE